MRIWKWFEPQHIGTVIAKMNATIVRSGAAAIAVLAPTDAPTATRKTPNIVRPISRFRQNDRVAER